MKIESRAPAVLLLEYVEALLGTMVAGTLAGLFAIATACVAGSLYFAPDAFKPRWNAIVLIAAGAVSTSCAFAMLGALSGLVERKAPHPTFQMSIKFAQRGFLKRLILGFAAVVMTLCVFALGQLWALLFEELNPASASARIAIDAIVFVILFGSAYASNGYLMCFFRAWNFPRGLIRFWYCYRYPMDLLISAGMLLLFDRLLK